MAGEYIEFVNGSQPAVNDTNLNLMQQRIKQDIDANAITVQQSYTSNNTDVYSCNYINNIQTYSTTEKRIGTWIDNKPVYRKVFSIGALPNADQKTITTDLVWSNNTVIKIDGFAIRTSDNNVLPINYPNPINATEQIACRLTGTNQISVFTGTDRTNFNGYVILDYTKNS